MLKLEERRLLPNLVIIGAGKCGTTSLHQYLALHPEVEMTPLKELNYFTRDDWKEQRPWYEAQFANAPVRGESSPGYTTFPYLPSTAARIHELVPDARLIYIVRDPLDRAIASYVELVALRIERRPIEVALMDLTDPSNPHLAASKYATQLGAFLELFPAEQILVLDHADLLSNRRAAMRDTFSFLGVKSDFWAHEFEVEHNTKDIKVRYNDLGYWMVSHGVLAGKHGPFKRGPLRQPFRRLLSQPINRSLPDEARNVVVGMLRPEVNRFRAITGKAFPKWTNFPSEP